MQIKKKIATTRNYTILDLILVVESFSSPLKKNF